MNISKNEKEHYNLIRIVNKHHIEYKSLTKIVIIHGPIKIEDFLKLKQYIIINEIDYKDIIVK